MDRVIGHSASNKMFGIADVMPGDSTSTMLLTSPPGQFHQVTQSNCFVKSLLWIRLCSLCPLLEMLLFTHCEKVTCFYVLVR